MNEQGVQFFGEAVEPPKPYVAVSSNDGGATWHIEVTRDLTREELLDLGLTIIRHPLPKPEGRAEIRATPAHDHTVDKCPVCGMGKGSYHTCDIGGYGVSPA